MDAARESSSSVRPLTIVLLVQVALAVGFIAVAATGNLPFVGEDEGGTQPRAAAAGKRANAFDGPAAFRWLVRQVRAGPRPAGSPASRKLARRLRQALPRGRYQRVPKGLRNVIGSVRGSDPDRFVVVGAHYDTKDIPGFVGANDGASGTAAVVQLARTVKPRELRPTVVFALFDGEESPAGTPDEDFERRGLRGSRVAARRYRNAESMILLDFVGDRRLSIPRERSSDRRLWSRLRAAARRAGVVEHFPAEADLVVTDDHTPFQRLGVPAIDLIDFEFPCFHKPCDDLSAVSEESLDASGEAVLELLRTL